MAVSARMAHTFAPAVIGLLPSDLGVPKATITKERSWPQRGDALERQVTMLALPRRRRFPWLAEALATLADPLAYGFARLSVLAYEVTRSSPHQQLSPKLDRAVNDSPDTARWLNEIKLERFKAAFQPEPIGLRKFNVIVGRNGTGKSTLIEALQWLDRTIRRDAREASDRYNGITDVMNLRQQVDVPFFALTLTWASDDSHLLPLRYYVKVEDREGTPVIVSEQLETTESHWRARHRFLETPRAGERRIIGPGITTQEPDRLALATLATTRYDRRDPELDFLGGFWSRAVFLRLAPIRLAAGSSATRKSFEPLLDEEGQTLPALLNELKLDQRRELVAYLREILPGIRDVEVSRAELGRDTRVHYSLLERMPYRGRAGRYEFPIPAWMLSEGTRRITAILALLVRRPGPSILCIEEIENGLDPWTVREILRHLVGASESGTQVIVTTHSPWVLDFVPLESILLVRRLEGDTRYDHFASLEEVERFGPSIPAGTRYTNILSVHPA